MTCGERYRCKTNQSPRCYVQYKTIVFHCASRAPAQLKVFGNDSSPHLLFRFIARPAFRSFSRHSREHSPAWFRLVHDGRRNGGKAERTPSHVEVVSIFRSVRGSLNPNVVSLGRIRAELRTERLLVLVPKSTFLYLPFLITGSASMRLFNADQLLSHSAAPPCRYRAQQPVLVIGALISPNKSRIAHP